MKKRDKVKEKRGRSILNKWGKSWLGVDMCVRRIKLVLYNAYYLWILTYCSGNMGDKAEG